MAYPQTLNGTSFDQDGRSRDHSGRIMPRRLGFDSFLRTSIATQLVESFHQVIPAGFWNADIDEDGDPIAVIACPCGEEPHCEVNRTVCCPCGRYYLHTFQEVRVWRPEDIEAGLPEADRSSP